MELTMQEKLKLISFFEHQLDKEASKPYEEIDTDMVDAYVRVLLDLQDKHVELSPEFINEQVRKLFHKEEKNTAPEAVKTKTNYFNKKKLWLIAACIAILVALFSIISVASDWNVFDFLSEKFGSVHSAPIGEEQKFNEISVINYGKNKLYTNIEDALRTEKIDILYPTALTNNLVLTDIVVFEEKHTEKVFFTFNDVDLYFDISLDSTLPKSTKQVATETLEINKLICFICESPDKAFIQVEFEHKGDTYCLSHTDKELLIEIISNLEEINNEN